MADTSLRKWIAEKVFDRLVGAFASWFTSLAEVRIRQSHIEFLSDVEDQARQLEADGKPLLAEQLRANSTGTQLENAGCLGVSFARSLSDGTPGEALKLEAKLQTVAETDKPARPRRRRRRSTPEQVESE